MMSRRRITGVFVTIVSAATGVLAPIAAGEALNPRTYVSPSGDYRLFVDPTTMTGAGPGRYRLLRGEHEVWSSERPVTLRDAVVTDEGVVAGYGYEGGVQDTGHHGLRYAGLTVVILDGTGHLRMRDAAAAHESGRVMREWSGSDSPAVSGMVVDPANDRFLVSIRRRGGQDRDFWWSYRLSSGESIADFSPDHPALAGSGFVHPVAIRHLPGTPLVLVQWYVHAVGAGGVTKGAVIALLDVSGRELWSLGLPGEYDGLGEKWDLHRDLIEPGYVQLEVEPAEFSFRSYSLASRVTFSVTADPGADAGWRVTEKARAADRLESGRRRSGDVATEQIELLHAGTIRLQGPARADSPIDNVNEFAIDTAGNLGFVRWKEGTAIFVLVDPAGPDHHQRRTRSSSGRAGGCPRGRTRHAGALGPAATQLRRGRRDTGLVDGGGNRRRRADRGLRVRISRVTGERRGRRLPGPLQAPSPIHHPGRAGSLCRARAAPVGQPRTGVRSWLHVPGSDVPA
jgi:hypothetical protein